MTIYKTIVAVDGIAFGDMLGEIDILDADSHSQMIQLGSIYPLSDEE